jgi:hypothetical protein
MIFTAEDQLLFQKCPCGLCGGHNGTETRFSPVRRFFLVSFIPLALYYTENESKINHLHHRAAQ